MRIHYQVYSLIAPYYQFIAQDLVEVSCAENPFNLWISSAKKHMKFNFLKGQVHGEKWRAKIPFSFIDYSINVDSRVGDRLRLL
jgi:hypothetical protein